MTRQFEPIALLGTSADPPTFGHKALLQGLLTLFPKVVTWASDNPMKRHEVSLEKRHSLLSALVKEINNTKLELIQELSSPWTITTLERATQRWPKSEFIFVIGSDLNEQIIKWIKAKEVLKKARLGIVPREGWPVQEKQLEQIKSLGGKVDLLPLKIPNYASSEVRKNLRNEQIPPAVFEIVIKQNLYGLNTTS